MKTVAVTGSGSQSTLMELTLPTEPASVPGEADSMRQSSSILETLDRQNGRAVQSQKSQDGADENASGIDAGRTTEVATDACGVRDLCGELICMDCPYPGTNHLIHPRTAASGGARPSFQCSNQQPAHGPERWKVESGQNAPTIPMGLGGVMITRREGLLCMC